MWMGNRFGLKVKAGRNPRRISHPVNPTGRLKNVYQTQANLNKAGEFTCAKGSHLELILNWERTMRAICIADYTVRLVLATDSSENVECCLPAGEKTTRQETRAKVVRMYPCFPQSNESLFIKVGYAPASGVNFSGEVTRVVEDFSWSVFNRSLRRRMFVYLDEEFDKIPVGVHEVEVYEKSCLLYKKRNCGEKSGVIVLKNSKYDNFAAKIFLNYFRTNFD